MCISCLLIVVNMLHNARVVMISLKLEGQVSGTSFFHVLL